MGSGPPSVVTTQNRPQSESAPLLPETSAEEARREKGCLKAGQADLRHGLDEYLNPADLGLSFPSAQGASPWQGASLVWNPDVVRLFESIDYGACGLNGEETTPFAAYLRFLLQTRFLPILCKYQNNPADYAYAVFILNTIADHLCRASRLERFPGETFAASPPYSRLVLNYFLSPAVVHGPPYERYHVDRLELGSVDPFNSVKPSVAREAEELFDSAGEIVAKRQMTDLAARWSRFAYDRFLIQPPQPPQSPDGDLPLELQYVPPISLGQADETLFFRKLVFHDTPSWEKPKRAGEILKDFSRGLEGVMQHLQKNPVPFEAQFLGVENPNNRPQYNAPPFPPLKKGDSPARNPVGRMLGEWGLNGIQNRYFAYTRSENADTPVNASLKKFVGSSAWVSFPKAFDDKWSEISGKFTAYYAQSGAWQGLVEQRKKKEGEDYDSRIVEERFDSFVRDVLGNVKEGGYDKWVNGIWGGIIAEASLLSVFYAVQSWLLWGEERGSELGKKEDLRFLLYLMLKGCADVLKKQEEKIIRAASFLGDQPETAGMFETIRINYRRLLWFFGAMTESYGRTLNRKPDRDGQESFPPAESPFMENTLDELGQLKLVMEAAKEEVEGGQSDPGAALAGWKTYGQLRKALTKRDPRNFFAGLLLDFIEMRLDAPAFYAAVSGSIDGSRLAALENLLGVIAPAEQKIESEVLDHLPAASAVHFITRLRYAIFLLNDASGRRQAGDRREKIPLEDIVSQDLQRWTEALPLGWPKPDGCTEKLYEKESTPPSICPSGGFKGDFSFIPDRSHYLTAGEFVSFFEPESDATTQKAVTMLTRFLADYDAGYYRFFTYGGYGQNSGGERVVYVRERVALNQLLLVLRDIAESAEIHADTDNKKGREYARYVNEVAAGVSFNLEALLNSRMADDPFWVLMDEELNYTNIMPARVVHARDPVVNYGTERQEALLAVRSVIWQGRHQPRQLIDWRYSRFDMAQTALKRARSSHESPSPKLIFLEQRLAPLPKPSPFDLVNWYLRKGGAPEFQYLIGRLLERAKGKDVLKAAQRHEEIAHGLENTSLALVKAVLPPYLRGEGGMDENMLRAAGLPEPLLDFLAGLTPEERVWLAGSLSSRLALTARFYGGETDEPYFEMMRQQEMDEFIRSLSPAEAEKTLDRLHAELALDELAGDSRAGFGEPEALAVIRKLDEYFGDPLLLERRKQADSLYIRLNKGYGPDPFGPLELLYLAYLVSADVWGASAGDRPGQLEEDLEKTYPAEFDGLKIADFYPPIPDSEKPVLYAFLYNLVFERYKGSIHEYLEGVKGESSVLLDPTGLEVEGNQFWKWLDKKFPLENGAGFPEPLPDSPFFREDEFSEAEIRRVFGNWGKDRLEPPMPHLKGLSSGKLADFLNQRLSDRKFHEKNKERFAPLIERLNERDPQQAARLARWIGKEARLTRSTAPTPRPSGRGKRGRSGSTLSKPRSSDRGVEGLTGEEIFLFNSTLFGLVDPLLSPEIRTPRVLAREVDSLLAEDFDWNEKGGIVLDIPTQFVLESVLKSAMESLEKLPEKNRAVTGQIAFLKRLSGILFEPYNDQDPFERAIHSRYNPNRYSGEKDTPPVLSLVFSRDYFSVQTGTDNPFVLKPVHLVLTDMRQMIEGVISEDKMEETARTRWDDREALKAVREADYYVKLTKDFYRHYDFEEAEAAEERLERAIRLLDLRIRELDQGADAER